MYASNAFVAGLMAVCALAAPTPNINAAAAALSKRSFKVPVQGWTTKGLSPAREMAKIFHKYGWSQQGFDPFDGADPFAALQSMVASEFGTPSVPQTPSPAAADAATAATAAGNNAAHTHTHTHHTTPTPFPASNSTTAPPAAGTGSFTTSISSRTSPAASSSATSTGSPTSSGSGSAEVTTTPEDNNSEYLTPVSIAGQQLNLDFDTGSADLWVFSTELAAEQRGQHAVFDASKSKTFQKLDGASWKISYGDGSSASGDVGYDVVAVGSATVTKQAVELATQVAAQFERDTNNDGLLGLAFGSINTVKPTPQKTFFENVMGSLAKPLFSVDLGETSGTYEFGAVDGAYNGQLHYVDIDTSAGFWQFESTQYSVGGKTATNSQASPAIADTGTSLILTDDAVVKAYYAQVQGATLDNQQGGYVYPCTTTLPDFGVQVGDYMVNLKGSGLTYAKVDTTGRQCFGGIQSNAGAGYQILGDVMLRQTYAVFDGGNEQFGIAPKAAAASSS